MLSRVAENLYWISRYVERAEYLARLLDDAYQLELEASTNTSSPRPLDNVMTILDCQAAFQKRHPVPPSDPVELRDAILRFLTFDRNSFYSIRAMVGRGRENARGTQETLTAESWAQLNKLFLYLSSSKANERFEASAARFFTHIRRECMMFSAIIDSTLSRSEAYHFLQVGRYLERVDMLSRILNVHCSALALSPTVAAVGASSHIEGASLGGSAPPADMGPTLMHWTALLRSCSAYESYLREAHVQVAPAKVIRFLLLESDFPRSMRFGVMRCLESLRAIAGNGNSIYGTGAERHLGRLDSELRYMDIDEILQRGIGTFLASVQECCGLVGRDIHLAYFRT
ncbi:alpha-E domain-containing protein [Tuwongella immobilis]|uniref:DUF403 domain-containing protein n=1 Tax=Tuwongella immobilis TaxID=692036 RepID=A0A6C2YTR2_9BACT|nr:alpha-E domain-containing protein [Tuwongella immobilis]VIP05128.1 Uncharacterized protein OS=Singulisphaera acidiphila (strain ATCC BAA-1392 / DSM 18658 / VKM B-2454 / MOB10) GN=Sinac_5792 PE=4 SV=1: Alpha-E [Tuwongella immobilis]VTS07612.1 Uncharacterized protein OS=Singulisphaera acidiphila (strain ATCC BAA-1392 / DSM 18658 / VKM B-2454 / MOB10) GN=Sinac_5792 PE=4 SV=1: Alpha-E [Tuwongella immobilis]